MGKAVDISEGIGFVAVTPCRVVDTRPSQGFPPAWGPPILAANATRDFDLDGAPHCIGIPSGVEAYSLNFTIAEPSGPGDLRAYPQGIPPATPTSIMNWSGSGPAFAIANSAIIPAGGGAGITVQVAGANAHLIIDINGYFTDEYNAGNFFSVIGTYTTGAVALFSNLTTTQGFGVHAVTRGTTNGATGVNGLSLGTSGYTFGVKGTTASSNFDSAGVKGVSGYGDPLGDTMDCGPCLTAGVRGVDDSASSFAYGVLGVSRSSGVAGVLLEATGTGNLASGYLGYRDGTTPYAGYFAGNVHVAGTLTATSKPFVQPHATDPSKEIVYIALEGRRSEVYFRGTAQISHGVTRIDVPEDFRMVARPGTFSTLVTPVGGMATVAVISEDENGIVLQASRNVKVHYLVYAERSAYPDHEPIQANIHFRPGSQDDLVGLPESYLRILKTNGILKQDGTIDEATAHRLGWSLNKKTPQAAPKN